MLEDSKKAYKQILKLLKKNEEFININIGLIERSSENHLFLLVLKEVYGLNINTKMTISTKDFVRFTDDIKLQYFGGYTQYIPTNIDKDLLPKDGEYLLNIWHSTGAYIFSGDYDYNQDTFKEFYEELKTYKPDYIDHANRSLYWKLENAKDVFNAYNDIYNKYKELSKERLISKKREALEKEIEKLKELEKCKK